MTDYTSWHVGMEVVCAIDAARLADCIRYFKGANWPQVNGVYKIRAIRDDTPYGGDGIKLLLEGVHNEHLIGVYGVVEPGFDINRFRPIQKRKTDISIFTMLLKTKSEKELVQ